MAILTYLHLMWESSRARSALFFSLLLLSSVTEGIGLVVLVPLLGTLQETQADPSGVVALVVNVLSYLQIPITFIGLLGVFLALNILRATILFAQTIVSEHFRLRILDDLRTAGFDAILQSRWDWITAQKKSDISSLLINEINRIGSALTFSVRLIVSLLSIAAYVVAAISLSPLMASIAVGLGGILFLLMRRQHRLAHTQGLLLSDANRQVQQTVEEGLSGLKLIKILRSETRHSQLMRQIRNILRGRTLQFTHLNATMTLVFQILVAIIMVALLYFGAEMLELSLPTLLILILIFARLAPQIRQVQTHINGILHAEAVMDNYRDLLRRTETVKEPTLEAMDDDRLPFKTAITLKNIGYSYKTRATASLENISLEIPYRKTTAIMGGSGSGKSTLADLVMGLLTPDNGTIEIDGVPLTDENRLLWRKSIAYMSQDIFLFHDTIKNNLLWADEQASDAELETALRNASADFVFDLPEQMETIVGDAGQRLSGGEKQRIALARAMLQKPQLLILDEATSALDRENEIRIRETIDTLHAEMTVIVIGHRLPTLENADQLILLDNGCMKASGSWQEVMGKLENT